VVGVDEANGSNLNVYPNPASDILNIASSNDGTTQVTITDMAGRTVQSTTLLAARRAQLDVSTLPAGIYVVTIENNTELLRRAVQLVK
jgi:hypothetical protein